MKTIKTLTLNDAKKAIKAMEKKASEMGIDFCFCITDCMKNILIIEKMDGVKNASLKVSMAKAMTALNMKDQTKNIGKMIREMDLDIAFWAGSCETGFGGGIPVYENEASLIPVGAIGVSGGTQEQDEEICFAGLKAIGLATK